jgi:hypothetical protein
MAISHQLESIKKAAISAAFFILKKDKIAIFMAIAKELSTDRRAPRELIWRAYLVAKSG